MVYLYGEILPRVISEVISSKFYYRILEHPRSGSNAHLIVSALQHKATGPDKNHFKTGWNYLRSDRLCDFSSQLVFGKKRRFVVLR